VFYVFFVPAWFRFAQDALFHLLAVVVSPMKRQQAVKFQLSSTLCFNC
jgi:hypothetical protein